MHQRRGRLVVSPIGAKIERMMERGANCGTRWQYKSDVAGLYELPKERGKVSTRDGGQCCIDFTWTCAFAHEQEHEEGHGGNFSS